MNETAIEFFENNGIDFEQLSEDSDSCIFRKKDLDFIVSTNGEYQEREWANISIADMIGYDADYNQTPNIFENFSLFFDRSNPLDYKGRSCSLLDIPREKIIESLSSSFIKDPIIVQSLEPGKNLILHGMHRFMVIKSHFLNESHGLDKESEEYQQLRQKYTIPVKADKVDYLKTYSKFLLRQHPDLKFDLYGEKDAETNVKTGKSELTLPNGEIIVLDDAGLIEKVREIVLSINNSAYFGRVMMLGRTSPHFFEYVNQYIPEINNRARGEGTATLKDSLK